MTKLSAIQKKTISVIAKTGFSFAGDSHFVSFNQAKRCFASLVEKGFLVSETNDYGYQYKFTELGRYFAKWGFVEYFEAA